MFSQTRPRKRAALFPQRIFMRSNARVRGLRQCYWKPVDLSRESAVRRVRRFGLPRNFRVLRGRAQLRGVDKREHAAGGLGNDVDSLVDNRVRRGRSAERRSAAVTARAAIESVLNTVHKHNFGNFILFFLFFPLNRNTMRRR